MKEFFREFKVEILVFGVAILGALIWFDPLGIRTAFGVVFKALIAGIDGFIPDFEAGVMSFFSSLTVVDVVGFFVLTIATVFVFLRTRSRYMGSEFYISRNCPKCGNTLRRVQRKWPDRVFGKLLFIPLHRYRCNDRQCGWSGLRKPGRHHHKWSSQEEEELRDQLSLP